LSHLDLRQGLDRPGRAGPLPAIIVFPSAEAAEARIAGVPAAARVVREAALAGFGQCRIEAGAQWRPGRELRAEVDRLRGTMAVDFAGSPGQAPVFGPVLLIAGEALPPARLLLQAGGAAGGAVVVADAGDRLARARLARLAAPDETGWYYARLGRAILRATGKTTDGIVSRYLNRPLSRAMTGLLLRVPGFRPIHATFGTAALAVLMFACLLFGGTAGLLSGAFLFHAASVFDGVDGEAARATFRTSDRGAMFDSLVDAATNLAFMLGLVINMALAGRGEAASFGACGLALLAAGLVIIGRRARASSGPFTFDGVKDRMRGTRFGQWLVWLTMRDFLALAAVVMVVLGLVETALVVFSMVMAGWLGVVVATGMRRGATLR
jgi:CDP-L-myo-inositol myo-inositolphosphotransferase